MAKITGAIRDEHLQLCQKIRSLDYEYYVLDKSHVSDAVYDSFRRTLLTLESKYPDLVDANSPSQLVGYLGLNQFKKVEHAFSMLSLANAFGPEDMYEWIRSLNLPSTETVLAELKLDGLSLSLTYVGGILVSAVTRGDGNVGEDVTINALHINGVRAQIKSTDPEEVTTVRGEVVVRNDVYQKIQNELIAAGKEPFANKRNYAAGSVRQKDPKVTKARQLSFIAYSFDCNREVLPSWSLAGAVLYELGFEVVKQPPAPERDWEIEQWAEYLEMLLTFRSDPEVDYEIDGIVFKVDSTHLREQLGSRSRSPRWATSYKFPASTDTTKVKDITWQVGRTGAVTPVAELEPVLIHGTVISRLTLHGIDVFTNWGLHEGDTVVVERAGDVIPAMTMVVDSLRPDNAKPFVAPETCPSCGGPLVEVVVIGKSLVCQNHANCPDQAIATMEHIASRKVFNIMGVGKSVVTAFYNANIRTIVDIFKASPETIQGLIPGANGIKAVAAIHKARTQPLERVLMALCIPSVGEDSAKRLAQQFVTLSNFIETASLGEIMAIPQLGDETAANVIDYRTRNIEYMNQIDSLITIVSPQPDIIGQFTGMRVCVSGNSFAGRTRKDIEQFYISQGAKLSDQVTGNVALAVFGQKCSPGKLAKARSSGTAYLLYTDKALTQFCGMSEEEARNGGLTIGIPRDETR